MNFNSRPFLKFKKFHFFCSCIITRPFLGCFYEALGLSFIVNSTLLCQESTRDTSDLFFSVYSLNLSSGLEVRDEQVYQYQGVSTAIGWYITCPPSLGVLERLKNSKNGGFS